MTGMMTTRIGTMIANDDRDAIATDIAGSGPQQRQLEPDDQTGCVGLTT